MEWIKVSERLPYTSMTVLATMEYSTEHGVYQTVGTLSYDDKRKIFFEWDPYECIEVIYDEVTAWMPLPEPYCGE